MGYSYTVTPNGRRMLDCDICGECGGVKRFRCPWGYCQPIAACPKCRKERAEEFGREKHRAFGCESGHEAFVAEEKQRRALLDAGFYIRVAAMNARDNSGRVHVLFRNRVGTTLGFYMTSEQYARIPLGKPATQQDFIVAGEALDHAPIDFFA